MNAVTCHEHDNNRNNVDYNSLYLFPLLIGLQW